MPHVDLLELPYFSGISFDELVAFIDLLVPTQYSAGDTVIAEGSNDPTVLLIATTGSLSITKTDQNGKERRLADLVAPTIFGEIELFCQIPPVCTATAATYISAFTLNRPTFDRLFAQANPALMRFTFNVARVACHRLAIADDMLANALGEEDLCELRRSVWGRMTKGSDFMTATGAFRLHTIK